MRPVFENIPAVSILLMLLTGIISIVPHNRKTAYRLCLVSLGIVLAASVCLTFSLANGHSFSYAMGNWGAPWGNELRSGPLEALMAAVFSFSMIMAILGGRYDAECDIKEDKQAYYYIMLDLLMASLLALIYTNDLFTGYVFIEINTITACALVMAKEEGKTLAATVRYLIMSLVGSSMFLLSVALLYGITGQLLMESLAPQISIIAGTRSYILPLAALSCLMICGLSIKSALYPFSTWLPDAHGTATTTSSAVLSGLVIKGYIILMVKVFVRCYGLELVNTLGLTDILFVLGALAMIMGSVKAIKETHIKRMIAYSSVAQVGYIFVAIGLGTAGAIAAAFFQIIAHAVTKSLIFVCAGGMIDVSHHHKQYKELDGAALRNPLAGIGFTIGGLAMVGIPLLGSFVAKLLIAAESVAVSPKMNITLICLGVSSVLNALYYLPAIIRLWLPGKSGTDRGDFVIRPDFIVSVVMLSLSVIVLGVCYRPVVALLELGVSLL